MKPPGARGPSPAVAAETMRSVLRIVLLYALLAALWILLSDSALGLFLDDAASIQAASTLKGLLFVAVTSVLLFFLVLRFAVRRNGTTGDAGSRPWPTADDEAGDAAPASTRARLVAGIVSFSLIFALLAAGAMLRNWQHHRDHAGELLRSVAQSRVTQVESWLEERRRDAEAMRNALPAADPGIDATGKGDAAARQALFALLEGFRSAMHYRSIAIVDRDGGLVWQTGEALPGAAPVLREAVGRALAERRVAMTDLYRSEDAALARSRFDVVVPMPASGLAVVLCIDVEASLYPLLQSWPAPSASAETLLYRRHGDSVLLLNDLRREAGTALRTQRPLSDGEVLAVKTLAPAHRPGELLAGVDYGGVPVLGVALPVAGTGWWLVAKIDRAEGYGAARKDSLWIGFSALAVWFAALTLASLYFQRLQLRNSRYRHRQQAEKLRALQLLETLADSSTDAIFAKDTAGRYLLFNKEAARLTGKSPAAVLGHDDTLLFPAEQAARIGDDDRAAMAAGTSNTFQETLDTVDGKRVFLVTKGPLRDADGQVVGVFGISRDISRLAEAETALRQERDLNQRYLDTVQTLMVALDADGRVTMINRFGCTLLGYGEAELVGANWFEVALPQPAGLAEMLPLFRRIVAGDVQASEYFENAVRCRDGSLRLLAWHNAVLTDAAGRVVGTLSSGEDISERKRSERELLRQADELSARNAELERFNRAMVGRELDMIALKRRVNALSVELGRAAPFDLAAIGDAAAEDGK